MSKGAVRRDACSERGRHRGEDRGHDKARVRRATQRRARDDAGRERGHVRRSPRPGQGDGAERKVLLSLERETQSRCIRENRRFELLAVRGIKSHPDRSRKRRDPRSQADREVRATPACSQQNCGMHERCRGEPAKVTVHMLRDAKRDEARGRSVRRQHAAGAYRARA